MQHMIFSSAVVLKTSIRILYGRRSKREEVPWHVGLYYYDKQFLTCGATLISPLKIITAAHNATLCRSGGR